MKSDIECSTVTQVSLNNYEIRNHHQLVHRCTHRHPVDIIRVCGYIVHQFYSRKFVDQPWTVAKRSVILN